MDSTSWEGEAAVKSAWERVTAMTIFAAIFQSDIFS